MRPSHSLLAAIALLCTSRSFADGEPEGAIASGADALAPIIVSAPREKSQPRSAPNSYDVSQNLQALTGSIADVLTSIPSVEVDANGVVSLRGSPNVLILIDGRPSAQLYGSLAGASLQQIPASDIERIEVLTNPPPEYHAEGTAGVINIITRKGHRPGLAGNANAFAGNRGRSQLGTGDTYSTGALKLFGSLTRRTDDRQKEIDSTLQAPQTGAANAAALATETRKEAYVAKAGVDYDINDDEHLSLTLEGGERQGPYHSLQTVSSGASSATLTPVLGVSGIGSDRTVDTDQQLSFEQRLRSADESLTLTAHRSTFHDLQNDRYIDTALNTAGVSQNALSLDTVQEQTELSADYVLPLASNRKIKLGLSDERDRNTYADPSFNIDPASGAAIPNPALSSDFQYFQHVQAAYGSYETQTALWSTVSGVRLERTLMDGRLLAPAQDVRHSYLQAFPSVHLERMVSKDTTLTLDAARRISRPDPGALNPYLDQRDAANYRQGNPDLLPQLTDSLEFGADWSGDVRSASTHAYARRSQDKVTTLTTALPGGVALATKENLPLSRSAGLESIAQGPLGKKFDYTVSGNFFYTQIDATALGTPGLRSTAGVNAKLSLDYRPSAWDTLQLSATRSDKRLTPQGEIAAVNQLNVGFSHQFTERLSGVLTVADLLDSQVYLRYANTPLLSDVYRRQVVGRIAYIGVSYQFGSTGKGKRSKSSRDKHTSKPAADSED